MMLEHSDLYPVFPEYLVCPEGVQCTGKADSSSAQSSKVSGTVELSGSVCDQPGRTAAGAAPAAATAAAAAVSADTDADSADADDEQDDDVLDDAELEEAHDEDSGEAAASPAGGSVPEAGTSDGAGAVHSDSSALFCLTAAACA